MKKFPNKTDKKAAKFERAAHAPAVYLKLNKHKSLSAKRDVLNPILQIETKINWFESAFVTLTSKSAARQKILPH